MKKTLIALMALAGVTAAQDSITLRYALTDWQTGNPANSATVAGTTDVSRYGYVNWTKNYSDIATSGKGVANLVGNGHFYITSDTGIKAGESKTLNTTDGFTLVFNGYATANWADFLSIKVGDTQYKLEANMTNGLEMYTPSTSTENGVATVATVTNVKKNTWYNYALTVVGDSYTLSVWDVSGTKLSSDTFTGATGNLVDVYEGARFSEHWYGGAIDNFGLYDGVLSDNNLSALVKSEAAGTGMVQSFLVPEPTTATLSLLALVGLAARRRRKVA
ncbi:MAG: PEP-CTERM sorting domain-containing protein [Akkermansia muciniphila]